ncbi:PD40 domain-containing protein [bacterium]|nr:PD40 domain-containing protein [bacterium]
MRLIHQRFLFIVFVLSLLSMTILSGCSKKDVVSGPYIGQPLPSSELAELFAPGWVTHSFKTRDMAMMPDGKEMYFLASLPNLGYTCIMKVVEINGEWQKPVVCSFSGNSGVNDVEPCISPDGMQFYFVSNRANAEGTEAKADHDIWTMTREGSAWGEPHRMAEPVNSEHHEFFPSVSRNGNIYFSRRMNGQRAHFIYRCRKTETGYAEAEKLPQVINAGPTQFHAFIARDESYIIVPVAGLPSTQGGIDYYISYRNDDDNWSQLQNLGPAINTKYTNEWSPFVTPAGSFFIFQSVRNIEDKMHQMEVVGWNDLQQWFNAPGTMSPATYWIKADFIEDLHQTAIWE